MMELPYEEVRAFATETRALFTNHTRLVRQAEELVGCTLIEAATLHGLSEALREVVVASRFLVPELSPREDEVVDHKLLKAWRRDITRYREDIKAFELAILAVHQHKRLADRMRDAFAEQ